MVLCFALAMIALVFLNLYLFDSLGKKSADASIAAISPDAALGGTEVSASVFDQKKLTEIIQDFDTKAGVYAQAQKTALAIVDPSL